MRQESLEPPSALVLLANGMQGEGTVTFIRCKQLSFETITREPTDEKVPDARSGGERDGQAS